MEDLKKEEKVVDLEKVKEEKKKDDKVIELTDDNATELEDWDKKATGTINGLGFLRNDYLAKENRLLQQLGSFQENFQNEVKRVLKRNKMKGAAVRQINYKEKKMYLV